MCLVLAIVIGVLAGFVGCNASQGYKTATIKNKMTSFSFEYPARLTRDGPDYFTHVITSGALSVGTTLSLSSRSKPMPINVPDPGAGKLSTFTTGYRPISIEIHVFDAKPYTSTAQDGKGRLEHSLSQQARWENYQLIERSQIRVSGIEAEFAYYAVDAYFPYPKEGDLKLEYVREVYFDYGGYIWNIEGTAHGTDVLDQIKADFDHIIQTFKILE